MTDDSQIGTRLSQYLPEHLWAQWQAGEPELALGHLRAVLHAVETYLPQAITRTRLGQPTVPAASGDFAQATLLFADISGFTALSERLGQLGREGAEIITDIVNGYFAAMLEIIARHNGDLLKFGGDALLVGFGGEDIRDAAVRGCRAALEMQQAMDRFAVIETAQGTFNLRMTVGLGTGDLFQASLGSSERLEFAVMGPAIKQMARAEDRAEAGEVMLDQATWEATGGAILAREHSPSFYHLVALTQDPPLPPARHTLFLTGVLSDAGRLVGILDGLVPYLPPGVLDRIVASPEHVMIEGEHRLVTVLFANFYGIDAIIEALGPGRGDEISTILNRHFNTMRGLIRKYGGMVNKVDSYSVGYRIMAVFGAPIAHEDDPARAVRAALEMQQAMMAFANLPTSAGRFSLKQRIGINTGYVFAGNLGSTSRQEYSVMGDEVNLASRLMGVAVEGEILISASTAQRVAGLFEWQERDPIKVKGKQQPVRCYQVDRAAVEQIQPSFERSEFFGREREMDLAQKLIDTALQGSGAGLDIGGDAGMGKTRLVAELSAYARERGMTVLRGAAISYGRDIPYLPWIGLLHLLFGFEAGAEESTERRRAKVVAALERADLDQWATIVGGVLGVEIPETPLSASLDARLRQQLFFDIVLQLILEQAGRSPLLLVLDNMQWADVVSLDLIAYVMRNVQDATLLFVVVHRPELDASPWCVQGRCQSLHLAEMDDLVCLALARAVLGDVELSAPLHQLVLGRAQGNPFFVEEISRALRESGAILQEAGEQADKIWVMADEATAVEVPTTLAGLLMSRIDRLEAVNRRLLQVAAVVGIAFRSPVLDRIYPYGDLNGTLEGRLTQVVRLGLLEFSPPDEYTFQHALTQEVSYESLAFARRRELHLRVGEDIERHHIGDPSTGSGEALAELYGVLAHHFDEGRSFDKAFAYLVKAGDKARIEYANDAALNYYRRALGLDVDYELILPDRHALVLDTLEAMGDVYLLVGRFAEATRQYQQACADPQVDQRRRSDLLCQIARVHERQGQYDEALDSLAQARQLLLGSEEDPRCAEMARIRNLTGASYLRLGELDRAIEEFERGLVLLAGLEHDPGVLRDEANLYSNLGTAYSEQGNYSQAAAADQHSIALRQQLGDLPGLTHSYNNLAYNAWAQGDLAGAREYLQRSLEISQQIGDTHMLALLYNNLGVVSFQTGQVERALDQYHAALALRQRIGDTHGVAQTYSNIGEAQMSLEHYAEARQCLERAAATFDMIQSEGELPEVYWLLAKVELAGGDVALAVDYAGRARRLAVATGNPESQGVAERVLACAHVRAGDAAEARQAFKASIASLGRAESPLELARSHYELGLFLLEQAGWKARSGEHLLQAAELFAAAGAEQEAEQARAVWKVSGKR